MSMTAVQAAAIALALEALEADVSESQAPAPGAGPSWASLNDYPRSWLDFARHEALGLDV